jgi:hypothetical protein
MITVGFKDFTIGLDVAIFSKLLVDSPWIPYPETCFGLVGCRSGFMPWLYAAIVTFDLKYREVNPGVNALLQFAINASGLLTPRVAGAQRVRRTAE